MLNVQCECCGGPGRTGQQSSRVIEIEQLDQLFHGLYIEMDATITRRGIASYLCVLLESGCCADRWALC